MNILPVLLKDVYKIGHVFQYPKDTTLVYSNFTPRKSRVPGVDHVVSFGQQYFVEEYLIRQFQTNFFDRPRGEVVAEYKAMADEILGGSDKSYNHIGELHELGYLPLVVKGVPEGTLVPCGVPVLTVFNTNPKFYWLPNMLETLLSNTLWLPMTSATTAFHYRRRFEEYAKLTGGNPDFIKWQGHDFSMRGLPGIEAAMLSGAAHLLSFRGTDSIPAISFLKEYYAATGLIGSSVPATEHSVMCMGMQDGEFETFKRLITEVYPSGIVSIVADTWDFWKVITEYLPRLKKEIMARDGKVVIRPDSGDPVKIICGDPDAPAMSPQQKGAIQCLWGIFHGETNGKGYDVLDSHIGLIYGDSITPERQTQILTQLERQRFASTNVVLGIGSYTYQYVTRDTYGFAMKATYGETLRGPQDIFKCPLTDDGTKKSAKGLLYVSQTAAEGLKLLDQQNWMMEGCGALRPIFSNGYAYNKVDLATIRARVEAQL